MRDLLTDIIHLGRFLLYSFPVDRFASHCNEMDSDNLREKYAIWTKENSCSGVNPNHFESQ